MRTSVDFRTRQIEILPHALKRPVMYGGNDFGAELYFFGILWDLCWIDERESEWQAIEQRLLWGCHRVLGQLAHQELYIPGYINEVTSTYAQVAHILDYYQPERLLSTSEWNNLCTSITGEFFHRDWTESQLHCEFGKPSHEVIGGNTTVACYAPDGCVDYWIFFDIARKYPWTDEDDWFDDPMLRDVRLARNRFQLLPFAHWCYADHSSFETNREF